MSNNAIRYPRMHVVQAGGYAPMGIMDEVVAAEEARREAAAHARRESALVNAYLEATEPKAYASVAGIHGERVTYYGLARPVVVTKVCFVARRYRYAHAKLQYLLK